MRISALNQVSFGRALKPEELAEFGSVRDEGKKLTGQTGKSIFIVPDTCLPQTEMKNTGVSSLANPESFVFFKDMKPYLGFNTAEVLPAGEISPVGKFYCAYEADALSLGSQHISPELLATDGYANLLKAEDVQDIVDSNKIADRQNIVNYSNVVDDDGAQNITLREKAYKNFKALDENHPLKQEFKTFVAENNDWMEPKSIFGVLAKKHGTKDFDTWNDEVEKNLYNPDYDGAARTERINKILGENAEDVDFYKFKQFLADKHLAEGKKNLNSIDVSLTGDCLIGFSKDEQWTYPKAFKKNHFIGEPSWRLPSLDYDTITNPDSDAAKLLKKKVQLYAKRYDSIRFDVAWAYVSPVVTPPGVEKVLPENRKEMGDTLLKFIENSVKEVKGQDYDLKNLIWEFDADSETFKMFKPDSKELIDPLKDRVKVLGSTYMHSKDEMGWGSNDSFVNKWKWKPEEFVLGIGNHDAQPLRQIANNVEDICMPKTAGRYHKDDSIKPLSEILKIDSAKLQDPVEFTKAKWAEPMTALNNQMFYMDVFGREDRFDVQTFNIVEHPEKNYARKITANYMEVFQNALREGFAFNIMDSLEKVFKSKGLDATHSELYNKIIKFRDILLEPEPAKAEDKALPHSAGAAGAGGAPTPSGGAGVTGSTGANPNPPVPPKTTESEAVVKQASKSLPKKLLIAFGIALAAGGGIFAYHKTHSKKEQPNQNQDNKTIVAKA